jgi:N-acetylglucosaminyl-diphospho-decaprenol L-rhamnosyltransferase
MAPLLASSVTIVIATRNRADTLIKTLAKLDGLADQPPVIVIDNASTDGTSACVGAAFPHVRVLSLPRNLGAAARNCGVALSSTPFVAFSDDDSWWAEGALAAAVDAARAEPHAGLVAARVLVGHEERTDPVSAAMAASPLGRRVVGFLACAAIVRRDAFLDAGGFDYRLGIGGEEELLALDLAAIGWDCIYAPQVVAYHYPGPRSAGDNRQQRQMLNSLIVAAPRRRTVSALARWGNVLVLARTDPIAKEAFREAHHRLRWVLPQRRPVGRTIERDFKAVTTTHR